MKIAIGLFVYFPWGGLQYDMLNIAKELSRRGAEVTIYTGAWKESPLPEDIAVQILPLSGRSNHARALDFERKFHQTAAGADVKFAFNRFGGCDYYFAADDCFALSLQKKKGAFLLKHLSRYKTFSRQEEKIFSPASKTHIFCISSQQPKDFTQIYHTPPERFTLLKPGIKKEFALPDEEQRQKSRVMLRAGQDQIICLFIAANWQLKGGDRLMHTFARLPEDLRSRMRLDFVGNDAKGRAQRLASRLGIADQCVFHGPRQDVEKFLQGADVLLHPARQEAAGNVIAESLACGVPVILTEVCGYASLVRESGAGIVLPEPFSEKTFAEAVSDWFADRVFFRQKAQKAAVTLDLHSRAAAAAEKIFSDHSRI